MERFRGQPSRWLLPNSKGYPDFLFTLLTYSMILLICISVAWLCFGVLAYRFSGEDGGRADILIRVMDNMKTGLVSLAGIIFGLAGSYTVRRFKKDEQFVRREALHHGQGRVADAPPATAAGLRIVANEEDI